MIAPQFRDVDFGGNDALRRSITKAFEDSTRAFNSLDLRSQEVRLVEVTVGAANAAGAAPYPVRLDGLGYSPAAIVAGAFTNLTTPPPAGLPTAALGVYWRADSAGLYLDFIAGLPVNSRCRIALVVYRA